MRFPACSLTDRSLNCVFCSLSLSPQNLNFFVLLADSGSDEDFLMEDDDDSDYGSSKKKNKKVSKKSKPERKEKKMPKPRLKATGKSTKEITQFASEAGGVFFCCRGPGRSLGVGRHSHVLGNG